MHPYTGKSSCLSLLDRFHQSNASAKEDNLRRVDCIRQFKENRINTQVDEQIYSKFDKDVYFMNMTKPVNHIFLLRSNINLHNHYKNKQLQSLIDIPENSQLGSDEFGRCILRRPEVYEELDMEIEIDVEEAENEYIFPDIQDVKEVTSTSIASEITEHHILGNLPLPNEMIDEALEMIKSENAYLNDSIHTDNLVTEGKPLSWDKRGKIRFYFLY